MAPFAAHVTQAAVCEAVSSARWRRVGKHAYRVTRIPRRTGSALAGSALQRFSTERSVKPGAKRRVIPLAQCLKRPQRELDDVVVRSSSPDGSHPCTWQVVCRHLRTTARFKADTPDRQQGVISRLPAPRSALGKQRPVASYECPLQSSHCRERKGLNEMSGPCGRPHNAKLLHIRLCEGSETVMNRDATVEG